jgi:type I restriction enzyme S subunit
MFIDSSLDLMESTATASEVTRLSLRAHDVVITKDSETADDIGIPAVVSEDLPGVVLGYHCALLRPRPGAWGPFLYWLMRSRAVRSEWEVAARGVTRVGLRQEDVAHLQVQVPESEAVQREIAEKLFDAAEKSVAAIEEGLQLQALLTERRQALITAAVIGRLDIEAVA